MALAWLAARVVGTVIGPLAIITAFMAYAPSAFDHLALVSGLSVGFGLVCFPRKFGTKGVAFSVVYVVVMVYALFFWTLFAAGWFPDAVRHLKIDL